MDYLWVICWTLSLAVLWGLFEGFLVVLWRPYVVRRKFQRQGVTGPPYKWVTGCGKEVRRLKEAALKTVLETRSHDYNSRIFPYHVQWSSLYGGTYLFWSGTEPWIFVSDVEMVKQILSNKFGFFTKGNIRPTTRALLGNGLALSEGLDWVRHRRVLNPAFHSEKLKAMTNTMAACTLSMFDSWEDNAEIEMSSQFKQLTADIISHTAFGNSYAEAKEVFEAQTQLQNLEASTSLNIHIPQYSKYLPSTFNKKKWSLEKKVKRGLQDIISERLQKATGSHGADLLGLMMNACAAESNKGSLSLSMDEIIDECKTFYFAGHETTASLLTWAMFLLCLYPEWQERLRDEVVAEVGRDIPTADTVSKLKLVTMLVLETLRLYNPVVMTKREAITDIKLGDLMIPRGTTLEIPISVLHRNKEVWGADANDFNPLRFESGVSKASNHPNGLLSFSLGPRICIGQNFALLEAKTVIAMVLQRFSLSLSPEYKHAPRNMLTLKPEFGLPIIVRTLNV